MKKPHGIHPRSPYIVCRMTEAEAIDLLTLLDGVDRKGAEAVGMIVSVHHYDNIAYRVRKARVRFPVRRAA